jgi:hypothetical protein
MSGNEESAAQDQPARCWLVSFSTLAGATYKEAAAANLGTLSNFKPSLAIDVGEDTISVMDANTNALVASAPLAQVTATPATRLGTDRERGYAPKGVPILIVCVPGAQRLTIGCQQHSQGSIAARVLVAQGIPVTGCRRSGWLIMGSITGPTRTCRARTVTSYLRPVALDESARTC